MLRSSILHWLQLSRRIESIKTLAQVAPKAPDTPQPTASDTGQPIHSSETTGTQVEIVCRTRSPVPLLKAIYEIPNQIAQEL